MYYAIIGDIIASRELTNRAEVQRQLKKVLDEINERQEGIAAKFTVTLGDEFQGLIKVGSGYTPIHAAIAIKNAIYPAKVRIGIGVGTISTDIDPNFALGADGEAFHNARKALNEIEANEHGQGMYRSNDGAILIRSSMYLIDEFFNNTLQLMDAIRSKWTKKQSELARYYLDEALKGNAVSQSEMSNKFGVTQGTISKNISSSDLYAYFDSFVTLSTAFNFFYGFGGK